MNKPYYPTLKVEIIKKGISQKEFAELLNISERLMSLKMTGKIDFWLEEAFKIGSVFPDIPINQLFSHETNV